MSEKMRRSHACRQVMLGAITFKLRTILPHTGQMLRQRKKELAQMHHHVS
jgi:hypothetical protein